jgi:RNA polymerase sigma-70 factor (ECF subfamily)
MSQTIDISEQQRIRRIIDCRQAGEGKASAAEYAWFVRQYSQQVLDFTSHMVTDIADAEEAAQDAFVKAFRSLDSFAGQSSFLTWVCRIAYHESLNRLKRKRLYWMNIDELPLSQDDIEEEELTSGREERIALMEEALDDLPPDERMLIHLYYYEDRPLREIAFIMDAESNALGVRLHRIRKKLLKMIKQKENGQTER